MFTRRATTEVVTSHENLGLAIGFFVEDEFRQLNAILGVTHFIEQGFAETGSQNGFQELLGNDHVGVDVDDVEGGCNTGEGFEFLHVGLSPGLHPSPFGRGRGGVVQHDGC